MSKQELHYKAQDLIRRIFCKYINHKFFIEMDPFVEKFILNRHETDGYFPEKDFEVVAWSNDYNNPYRFHVISKGFDVTVNADDGEIIRINLTGKDPKVLEYIKDNVKDWLNQKDDGEIITTIEYIAH